MAVPLKPLWQIVCPVAFDDFPPHCLGVGRKICGAFNALAAAGITASDEALIRAGQLPVETKLRRAVYDVRGLVKVVLPGSDGWVLPGRKLVYDTLEL